MSKSAIDMVIEQFTPCAKCNGKSLFRDYDEEGIVIYCVNCGERFFPAPSLLRRIATQVDET